MLVTSLSHLSDVHYHASRCPDFLDTPANTAALAGEAAFRLRDLQQPSSLSDPYLVAVPAAVHSSTGCPILDCFRHGHFPQQPRVPDPPQRHRPTSIYPYVNTLPTRGTSPTTSSALRLGLLLVRLVRSGVAERNGPNSAFWPAHWCCRTPRNL